MKKIYLLILLLSIKGFSQSNSYLDSVEVSISNISENKKIQEISKIPYEKYIGDITKSEKLFNDAIDMALRVNDSMALGDFYFKLSQIYAFKEDIEKQTSLVIKSIKIYELLNENIQVGISYGQLGYSLKRHDMAMALKYMRKGIKILEKEGNKTKIDPLYDNYGIMLGILKQSDSALYYNKKSLLLKKALNDSVGLGFGYANIANVYSEMSNFKLAKKYIDSSSVVRENINDTYGISVNYTHKADIFFNEGDYKSAIENYKKSSELANKNQYNGLERYCYDFISKSYKELNDYKNAFEYNEKFQTLKDSVLNAKTKNKVEQLKIEFETEKKEKEILAQRADLAEKELDLNRKNTQVIGLIILAVLLTILGYLFYSQQKLKNKQLQRESELKEALVKIETQNRLQEQRLRISRDLHDNIGAQLTFIISSLDNLKYGFELPQKLNDKLNSIGSFTSSTIYELRDTIWAMNKSEISMEDLQTRISNFIDKAHLASEGITFNFIKNEGIDDSLKFSSVVGMNIYRIIQEAVNNAIKYAEANKIEVLVEQRADGLKIEITDNGKGFDVADVEMGNGLNNMEKRAKEIGANFKLTSNKGKGTSITIDHFTNT